MNLMKNSFRPQVSARIMALLPALFLAGCGSMLNLPGGGDPPALYELTAYKGSSAGMDSRNWVLLVEEPSVPGAMRTDQITVRLSERRLEYLAGARWSDRTPHLLWRYLEESIENSGLGTVVGAGNVEVVGDYRLKVDVRDFSADVGGGNTSVHVRFGALVVRPAPAKIIGRKQFEASADARSGRAAAIIEAFNDALDQTTAELLTWLAELPDTD